MPPRQPRPRHLRAVPLPTADLGDATLSEALRRRTAARGRLVGPVTASQLGSLVWNAHATIGTVRRETTDGKPFDIARFPYPSAGGTGATRLAIVALNVTGLTPGCYYADAPIRELWRIGPPPSRADLEATSMWFGPGADKAGGIDISQIPAMLGRYVRPSLMRPKYGLRALRFATLEAGHLAQNLALVAAATGLALGTMGGFYDDLAHENVRP